MNGASSYHSVARRVCCSHRAFHRSALLTGNLYDGSLSRNLFGGGSPIGHSFGDRACCDSHVVGSFLTDSYPYSHDCRDDDDCRQNMSGSNWNHVRYNYGDGHHETTFLLSRSYLDDGSDHNHNCAACACDHCFANTALLNLNAVYQLPDQLLYVQHAQP